MLEHLRALREDRDLTQGDMAALLHVVQSTYSDYEHGVINIPIPALIKLAVYFKTSVDYILDLTDETKPYPRKRGIQRKQ